MQLPKPPSRTRVHLTPAHRELYGEYQANQSLTLRAPAERVLQRFGLKHAPALSSVSELVKRFHLNPDLQLVKTTDVSPTSASTLIDAELPTWVKSCSEKRLFLTGHLIRLKAECLRDELVATAELSTPIRESLVRLCFSKGCLFNFQRRHKRRTRRVHGEAGSVPAATIEKGRNQLRALT